MSIAARQRAAARPTCKNPFNYFNGDRAVFVVTGFDAPVKATSILYPSAYVLSGDTCGIPNVTGGGNFDPLDADKDDYTQNCVGGPANGLPYELWQVHCWARTSSSPMATPNGIRATTRTK